MPDEILKKIEVKLALWCQLDWHQGWKFREGLGRPNLMRKTVDSSLG
jgi:hypothetical protein